MPTEAKNSSKKRKLDEFMDSDSSEDEIASPSKKSEFSLTHIRLFPICILFTAVAKHRETG